MIAIHEVIGEAGVLDADARAVVELIRASGRPPLHLLGVEEARRALPASRAVLGGVAPPVRRRDLSVTLNGVDTSMRLYRPLDSHPRERLPLVLYFHGGGWMLGDLDYGDWFCASLTARLGIGVLNVGYRLAPEHPFPAAVEDAVAALEWVHGCAEALGARRDAMAVAGDSAGGNLAAVCALHARDARLLLKAQALIYPALDMAMATPSYRLAGEGVVLAAETLAWFKAGYLNGADEGDWRASPSGAPLAGLAPALLVSAGFDVLADEAAAYAGRLAEAGVAVRRLHFAGQPHGFLMWAKMVRQSQVALGAIVDELRRRLIGRR